MKKISISQCLVDILSRPNVASRLPIYEKYDKNVQGNTACERGDFAASVVVPFRDFSELDDDLAEIGVVVGTGGNPYRALIDPKLAAELAICEAALKTASVGGSWLGATDCLNFGNPEKKEQMAELVQGIEGVKMACEKLEIPIVSGNVSLYNESSGRSVPPSALVSVFARVDEVDAVSPLSFSDEGNNIWFLGLPLSLSGSEFLEYVEASDTNLPAVNYKVFDGFCNELREALKNKQLNSILPIVPGGVWATALQSAVKNSLGFELNIDEDLPETLFGEGLGVLVSSSENLSHITGAMRLGRVTKGEVVIKSANEVVFESDTVELTSVWKNSLRDIF